MFREKHTPQTEWGTSQKVRAALKYGVVSFSGLGNFIGSVLPPQGFPGGSMVKNLPAMQETAFDPWAGKIPWRREGQPTPVFLPGNPWTEEPVLHGVAKSQTLLSDLRLHYLQLHRLMSGRIIPAPWGRGWRFPGTGSLPTFWSLTADLGTVAVPVGLSSSLLMCYSEHTPRLTV